MNKQEVKKLYRKAKRKIYKEKMETTKKSLFDKPEISGCRSCGKVTWRPK